LDKLRFEALAEKARQAARCGSWETAAAVLREALALWRGSALADVPETPLICAAVTALEERRLMAVEERLEADLRLSRHADLVGELHGLVGQHPLREHLRAQLLLALYRCGRQAEALKEYQRARAVLVAELGVEPGPGLRRMHEAILAADPALLAGEEIRVNTASGAAGPLATASSRDDGGSGRFADGIGVAGPLPSAVACTLPADTATFTGRGQQVARICAAAAAAARTGRVVAIHAIDGMPGVGKTALAVHAGHLVAGQFPDRQLFVDLHAHTPGQRPADPAAVLAVLLAADGVDPRYVPRGLDERAAMWRDRLAGKRALLIFDNAASSGQVAPLLPGAAGCLVLVTSRRYLGDLPGAVAAVPLDTLPAAEAAAMFVRLAPRAEGEAAKVAEMVALCGQLPLAISLLASLFTRHPAWALDDLIGAATAHLLTVQAENRTVAAAFELSCQHLTAGQQRLFRHLGLHPGPDIDPYAAAALAGLPAEGAAELLDRLHGDRLLAEPAPRRYRMHNLIHQYARSLAAAGDPAEERDRALGRLLDYYQHTAAIAQARLAPQATACPAGTAAAAPPAAVPSLLHSRQALAWARAERANLLACLDLATCSSQHARVVALTAAVAALLRHDGPWTEAITRHTTAAHAALRLVDRPGHANALNDLGIVQRLTGDYASAAQTLEEALGIYRSLGDQLGHANALVNLGAVRRLTRDYVIATQALEEALRIYRGLGDQLGQANALNELGAVRQHTGDYPGTAQAHQEALGIYHSLGDQLGHANALNYLGAVRQHTGDYLGAVQALEEALDIHRSLGNRLGHADALNFLGDVRQLTGDYLGAAQALEEALDIHRSLGNRLGHADALNILGVVRRLTGDYEGAAQALEEALDIHRSLGNRLGQANSLNYLGAVRRHAGDYAGAAQALDDALGIYRSLGDRGGEVEALNEVGALRHILGDPERASACHQQALHLARKIGSSWDEAHALAGLGRCALTAGRTTDVQTRLRQAKETFHRIGAAEAADVSAELDALSDAQPAAQDP
jgi:tetratricopeptide (TPR) repeat protein